MKNVCNEMFHLNNKTIMHSSRMRTVRCSGHLLGEGGVCPWDVSARGCLPDPPNADRMTDACENITFPQLMLRTVKTVNVQLINNKWGRVFILKLSSSKLRCNNWMTKLFKRNYTGSC